MGARSGSLKQPRLASARNQGRGAAITPTIRECVEGRDQAEMALRMMQLQVKISGGLVGASRYPRLKPALRLIVACFTSMHDSRYRCRRKITSPDHGR